MVCPCPSRLGRRQLSNGKEGGWFSPKRHSISKRGIKRTEREKKIFYETLAALRGVVNWVAMDLASPAMSKVEMSRSSITGWNPIVCRCCWLT